jgi:hypothetical protein
MDERGLTISISKKASESTTLEREEEKGVDENFDPEGKETNEEVANKAE